MKGSEWSSEDDEILRKMWDDGFSASQIVGALSRPRSRNAVIGRIHRLGWTRYPTAPRPTLAKKQQQKAAPPPPPPPLPPRRVSLASAAASMAPALPPAYLPSPLPKGVSIWDLSSSTCRWPIGNPGDKTFHFCGEVPKAGHVYCGPHVALSYEKD